DVIDSVSKTVLRYYKETLFSDIMPMAHTSSSAEASTAHTHRSLDEFIIIVGIPIPVFQPPCPNPPQGTADVIKAMIQTKNTALVHAGFKPETALTLGELATDYYSDRTVTSADRKFNGADRCVAAGLGLPATVQVRSGSHPSKIQRDHSGRYPQRQLRNILRQLSANKDKYFRGRWETGWG
ncbi:hypothetical protein HKX48_008914, partial [Thoreauomyces humboldtii]